MAACAPSVRAEVSWLHIALNCLLACLAAFLNLLRWQKDCIMRTILPACTSVLPEKLHGECLWD